MQSGQVLNLGTTSSDKPPQMDDLIEETRSEVRRTRIQLERQQEEHAAHARRTKILTIVLAVLIALLIGSWWFAYPAVKGRGATVAEMIGLQRTLEGIGERMNANESQLSKWTVALPGVMDRLDQVQASMKTNLQAAKSQAQSAATQVGQRIREDVNQSLQLIESRMAGLESNQHEAHQTVSQLQEQVADLKRELATLRKESTVSAETIKQLQDGQQSTATELTGIGERIVSNQAAVGALANLVERQRVEFQLPRNRVNEVAPGIFLTVKGVDVGKQQIDGFLKFAGNDRTLRIQGQPAQKPLTFYVTGEERPLELIVTSVEKNTVSGYVLMPSTARASR
jgi:cell division protein FtsB